MKILTQPRIRIDLLVTLLCSLGLLLVVLDRTDAATITVTNANDSGSGSLRAALASATDGDTINFSLSYPTTITLTSGQLVVATSVTITGPGANLVTVSGNNASRVFVVESGVTVTISGLTITNGFAYFDFGAGILNSESSLTVSNCTITDSLAYGSPGGGIANYGVSGLATLVVSNCTLSGNSAGQGGGVHNDGYLGSASVVVVNSTISGNSANAGGGINNDSRGDGSADVLIVNSTLSGNSATVASLGGGIRNYAATVEIGNTILNTGASGDNIFNSFGGITSNGYNLSNDGGGGFLTNTGDQINTDPLLGPLQNNGGPTFTHALMTGSPAIDKGKDNPGGTATGQDQRGFSRPMQQPGTTPALSGDYSDIGAFEVQSTNTASGSNVSGNLNGGDSTAGGATITFSNVTTAGITSETTSTNGPVLPSGFQLGNPATYYDISTSATFSGQVVVCINYSDVTFPAGTTPKLLHYNSTTNKWVNVTTSLNTTNHIICGKVSSFSPFAVVEDDNIADLSLSMTGVKSSSKGSTSVTYTITVTNSGPDTASNVVVTDTLPAGTAFVTASPSIGTVTNVSGTITWSVGDMANSGAASATMQVTVTAKGKTTITNTATVTSDTFDPTSANNTFTTNTSTKGK